MTNTSRKGSLSMKRIFALLLAICMVTLCGCSSDTPEETLPETQPSTASTTPSTVPTQPTQPTETQPTEYTGKYNPLTGEKIEGDGLLRPFAVVLNNTKSDLPQYGVSDADILYETLIEGETRMLGIYYDVLANSGKFLGTIRSARYYFIQIAQAYDAVYVHNGGSRDPEIGGYNYFEKTGWPHMDTITSPGGSKYYENPNGGTNLTGKVVIRPQKALDFAKVLGIKTTREEQLDTGMKFDDEAVTIGKSGVNAKVWFNMSGKPSEKWTKSTTLTYNEADKLYYASQYGSNYVDGNDNTQVSFRNVLVLRTAISQKAGTNPNQADWLLYVNTTGSGTGYFLCNGQMLEINWSREKVTDPFQYTLASNGEPITFGVGKTYVAVVPNKATVEIS